MISFMEFQDLHKLRFYSLSLICNKYFRKLSHLDIFKAYAYQKIYYKLENMALHFLPNFECLIQKLAKSGMEYFQNFGQTLIEYLRKVN